jgi:hypothetical protein
LIHSGTVAIAQPIELIPPPYPPAFGGGFGAAVAGLPDIDGDGCGDVAVGSEYQFLGDPRIGRVFVFSGRSGFLLRTIASPLNTGLGFGVRLCALNDVNADGRGDLAVGAHFEGGGGFMGRVHVFSGATGAHLYSLQSEQPSTQASFALSLASAPDVNGDGVDDIVVGSEYEGAAYVFSGATGARLWRLTPQSARQFSRAVAGMPDADGDGRADIAVSAPAEPFNPDSPPGVLYIFSGATGQQLHRLPFRAAALAGVPDLDGDGRGDLLAGWEFGNISGGDADYIGFVRVISGATAHVTRTLASPAAPTGDGFGTSVAGLPDSDGDGAGDILVGALGGPPEQPVGAGAAYLFSGATGRLLRRVISPRPWDIGHFGNSLAAVPDANSDGRPEFAVGAIGEHDPPPVAQTGRAYLFLSCPADLNADGLATSQDFFDFLAAFFSGCP